MVSPSFVVRYALRELINHRRFALFFVLNLTLGLAGFMVLLMTRDSIDQHFQHRLRDLLGADWQVSTRIEPQTEDRQWLDRTFQTWLEQEKIGEHRILRSESTEILSVIHTAHGSKLVRVLGVDAHYPLYGSWFIRRADPTPESPFIGTDRYPQLAQNQEMWMDINVATALQLTLGDAVQLGDQSLTFGAEVVRHPSRSFGFTGFVPTVYVALPLLRESGLLATGSRVLWRMAYRVDRYNPTPPPQVPASLAGSNKVNSLPSFHYAPMDETLTWHNALTNLSPFFMEQSRVQGVEADRFSLTTPAQSNERLKELASRISGALNLISLIGLFFAGLGLAYLFRFYTLQRLQRVAIAQALGMRRRQALSLLVLQLISLTVLGLITSLTIGLAWGHFGLPWVSSFLGLTLSANLKVLTFVQLSALALLAVLAFTFPIFVSLRQIEPWPLLRLLPGELPQIQDTPRYHTPQERLLRALSFFPSLALMACAAVFLVGPQQGLLFMALLIGVIVLFLVVGSVLINALNRLSTHYSFLPLSARLALRTLHGRKAASLAGFLTIAVACFLVALLPPLMATLQEEARTPHQSALPAFFLFDVQDEQIEPLRAWADSQKTQWPNINLSNLSPQIRGRLVMINGQSINTPEAAERIEEGQRQFIRQGVNITFRDGLSSSESLVRGRALTPTPSLEDVVGISLEERYSERLGVNLGDVLSFSIHGLTINGRVDNIRAVRWNSFQPNFFIVFPTGVLEGAPKTWVANLSGIPASDRQKAQNLLVNAFSNVSAIDVGALVEELLSLANQGVLAVYGLAFIALFTGLTVLVCVALIEIESSANEYALIKILGGSRMHQRARVLLQFTAPSLLCALAGLAMALGLSQWFAQAFLQSALIIPKVELMVLLVVLGALFVPISLVLSRKVFNLKPHRLLSAD